MSFLSKIGEKYHELREHPVLHVVLSKYFIVALIFVVWFAFFDTNNIGSIIRTRRQVRAQKQQIEFYQREIASMDNKSSCSPRKTHSRHSPVRSISTASRVRQSM